MTPTELWLPLGAIAFHLYDATQGLWQNEVLFERAGGQWHLRAESPLRRWGRRLVLPNPFMPQRPLFRVAWSLDDTRVAGDADPAPLLAALRPLGVMCQVLLLMLLALWPLCWMLGAGISVLALFAAYYLLVIAALALVFVRRRRLALTSRAFWSLAFDVVACAPFAVNLVRRISLRHGIAGNPVEFAARHFDASTRARFAALVRSRLQESRGGEAAAPAEEARIAQWLGRLETAAA
ncbi:MAG: hypothetical protein U1F39_15500 [Steroidobacteraceae bacterium]